MNTAVKRNDWIGRTIDGRFPLLECLADSGVEAVFRTDLGGTPAKRAVIRLIRADAGDATSRAEAWAAASKLSHPHLMRIFHTGRCEIDNVTLLYAVTEFAEESLSEVIPDRPLTPDEAREMLVPILDALAYLHRNGMVHGHLEPSNILVVDNQLKLPVDNLAGPTATSEAARGVARLRCAPKRPLESCPPASDVWSLGITLVEALTQHPPLWDRSKTAEPAVPASVPQPFADMARGCLRVDAQKRLTLRALEAVLDPSRPVPVPVPRSKRLALFRSPNLSLRRRNDLCRKPASPWCLARWLSRQRSLDLWLLLRTNLRHPPHQPQPRRRSRPLQPRGLKRHQRPL